MTTPIRTPEQLGALVRAARNRAGLTQRRLAARAAVGARFLSDLEHGKPTAELGKALQLLGALNLHLAVEESPPAQLAQVLAAVRAHAPELRERGVRHAGVFGSTARGEERPDSDVDLLLDLDDERVRSLLDLAEIQSFLQDIIGRPVDIADRARLKPHVAPSALTDVVDAF